MPPTPKPFILVVDDDRDLRDSLRELLESEGYGVFEASDGHQALRLIARVGRPGAIILDLAMPGMSGHGFLAYVRAQPHVLNGTPIVLVTGQAGPHDGAPPVAGRVQKPFAAAALLAIVAEACAR